MHFMASKADGGATPGGRNCRQKVAASADGHEVRTWLKPHKTVQREELP
jgi:hypothetical protein